MPNTSSSVPFLLSSSMQSIRSRRPSTVLSSGPLGSGSGLLQQLGSGMVRQLTATSTSGTASPVHHAYNGHSASGRFNYVRKCPSLNITFSNWNSNFYSIEHHFYSNQKNLLFLHFLCLWYAASSSSILCLLRIIYKQTKIKLYTAI